MKTTVSKLADIKTHTQPIECFISAWVKESILPFSLGTMGILLCFAYAWQSIKYIFWYLQYVTKVELVKQSLNIKH